MATPAILNNLTPIGAGGTTTSNPGSPSVKHDIGQLFGHALNALPGYSTLGANITNPNINYQGVSNPGDPGQAKVLGESTTNVAAPAPQQQLQQTDPYAGTVFGSTAGYNKAVADFNDQKNTTLGSINDNLIGGAANSYKGSILDYLDARQGSQNNINSESVQNELARMQGMQGINDFVGNGIKSGGVVLANDNAGSSSAGEALARAYGMLGRQQASSVGNQAAQGQSKIDSEQATLQAGDATQLRHANDKTGTITDIVSKATAALDDLNTKAATASIPDRVNIDQHISQIKQQAMAALSAYDQTLTQGIASQAPQGADATRAKASALLTAGTAPENSFNYTTDVPAQLQGSGQFASSLPIFVAPNKRQVTA